MRLGLEYSRPQTRSIGQVGAADRAWSDARRGLAESCCQTKAQCTSLKANVGHLEAAAAAAGLVSLRLNPLGAAEVAINAQMRGRGLRLDSRRLCPAGTSMRLSYAAASPSMSLPAQAECSPVVDRVI